MMPRFSKFFFFLFLSALVLEILIPTKSLTADHTAIEHYYTRYDIKSTNHQITDENLVMVPAADEFRTEKFSRFSIPCVISMTQGESKNQIRQRAKNQALKNILREKGLKSVKAKNGVTIVSYEGVVVSPIDIVGTPGKDPTQFAYTAQFEFSRLAFPDQWQHLKFTTTLKKKLDDFFSLFK